MDIPAMINYASELADAIGNFVPKIVATCSVLAAFLPAPDGDSWLSKVHRTVNVVAFNFLHAQNKDA